MDVLEILRSRGFVAQVTREEELRERLTQPVTIYAGFDPTADSLHVGNLAVVQALATLQRAGHRVVALVGGGTAMVGDPSGRDSMRQMMTVERVASNKERIRAQLSRFLDLDGENGQLVDNADWLLKLQYIPFLRDIGREFSVNRMLTAEAYRSRLEKGLSFIEFNYQLLQAYDFLELSRRAGCVLQIGGDDQWGNILAGTDLIRRKEGTTAFGLTIPLITTASGAKMGKTANGAVWLDGERFAPFDFFQYWYNVDDADVGRFLRLFTFLPEARIAELEALRGSDLRTAKKELAREVTARVHGEAAAAEAVRAVEGAASNLPVLELPAAELASGIKLYDAMQRAGFAKSNGEGRRLIKGGGVKLDGERVQDPETVLDLPTAGRVLRVGKKRFMRLLPL